MLTLLVFIVILGLLIFVHEAGHFVVARLFKVFVEEFAFGFPPRLFSWKRGETRYALNLFPVGGYVKLLGEDGSSKDPRSFGKQPVFIRLAIAVAGVFMNFLLAILAMWIGFMVGMTPIVSTPQDLGGTQSNTVIVAGVLSGSAAEKAAIQPADVLVGFTSADDLKTFTKTHAGQSVEISLRRNKQLITKTVTLGTGDAPLGVAPVNVTKVKLGPIGALRAAVVETWKTAVFTLKYLGSFFAKLFTRGQVEQGVVGFVGIYGVTSQAVQLGFSYVVQLLAVLSINLALLNILPIPALDGGRALFVALEGIVRRKVVREEIENLIHTIGFILLILLMLIITYRDITHLH